jgi:L-threonylcarbamoyladenylate synthase
LNTEFVKISVNDGIVKYTDAAELLKNNQVVGMPTETVYGLAGNAYSDEAVNRIFEAKGRPQDNPLIVHISEFSEIYDLVSEVPENAKRLAEAFWPGPLTMILPKAERVPLSVTAGLDTVAVRCPSHPIARNLIKSAGVPLAAPSANLSGKPSPTKAEHVFDDLKGRIPYIIDGGECDEGVESTVITLATDTPKLLRPGNVTLSQLKAVLGEVVVDDAVLNPLKKGEKVSSPGMKYKHYSPVAEIILVKGDYNNFVDYVNSYQSDNVYAMVFDNEGESLNVPFIRYGAEDYKMLSHSLFDSLRELDKLGAAICFVRYPDESNDDNLAVLNRLLRAAGFKVIDV